MTLDIGPGRNVQPHFDKPVVRMDRRLEVGPAVLGDARALPFRSDSFSTVYASHILEHFHWKDVRGVLAEWARVTAPGGEMQVFVPNLEWAAAQLDVGICDEFVLNALYGRQEYALDVHRTGFTPTLLAEYVSDTGLWKEIEIRTFRNSICVWARKADA